MAELLWTPSPDADDNLLAEGIPEARIERVGNIMIDSYELRRSQIEQTATPARLGLESGSYGVVTLHRPVNVDNQDTLRLLAEQLIESARALPLAFPVHPRTRERLEGFGLSPRLR